MSAPVPALAQAQPTTTAPPAPPPPRAYALVDADTGAVIEGFNHREPLPPASLSKVVTALAAVYRLAPGALIPVSARVEAAPAHKLNMRMGEEWPLEQVLHALLFSSANDAAVAVAERISGTVEAFGKDMDAVGRLIGMQDQPVFHDPAGLDDDSSIRGGNLVSARDLAIAARAALADGNIAAAASQRVSEFTDPAGMARRLVNHNRLLRLYPGAVGLKTGYTRRAKHCLIAAATREGRTMIAVVVGADGDMYGIAGRLLDKGFATPVAAQPADRLPSVPPAPQPDAATAGVATGVPAAAAGATAAEQMPASSPGFLSRGPVRLVLLLGLTVAALRTRVRIRRAARRRRRARALAAARRRALAQTHAYPNPPDAVAPEPEPLWEASLY